jgi:hypothetical protein
MPSYNISREEYQCGQYMTFLTRFVVDDISPLIAYNGLWSDSRHDDPQYVRYIDQTFHATQTAVCTTHLRLSVGV